MSGMRVPNVPITLPSTIVDHDGFGCDFATDGLVVDDEDDELSLENVDISRASTLNAHPHATRSTSASMRWEVALDEPQPAARLCYGDRATDRGRGETSFRSAF